MGRDSGCPEMPRKRPPRRWCPATTEKGTRCEVPPRAGAEWCIWHDPDWSEAERLRELGGLERKAQRTRTVEPDDLPPMPATPEETEGVLRWCVEAIATGAVDAVTGRAISDTLRTLHSAQTARLGLEKRAKELERKLQALTKDTE